MKTVSNLQVPDSPKCAECGYVNGKHRSSCAAGSADYRKRAKLPPIKKNPVPTLVYVLHIQKGKGPVMAWNGNRFTNNGEPKRFSRADTAQLLAKRMIKKFSILSDYKVWVGPTYHTPIIRGQKHRALRGGSKAPKVNPSSRQNDELDDAAKKLENFTGHKVGHLESAYSRSPQKTGLIIGELDLVGYRATRDGKSERYGHHFKKHSRPLLAVTSDGKQLHIVGGQYEFTEAGIEDR